MLNLARRALSNAITGRQGRPTSKRNPIASMTSMTPGRAKICQGEKEEVVQLMRMHACSESAARSRRVCAACMVDCTRTIKRNARQQRVLQAHIRSHIQDACNECHRKDARACGACALPVSSLLCPFGAHRCGSAESAVALIVRMFQNVLNES